MEVPGSPQDVTEELLSKLDLKGLLDLYAKAFSESWATVKEAVQTEIERRINEGSTGRNG